MKQRMQRIFGTVTLVLGGTICGQGATMYHYLAIPSTYNLTANPVTVNIYLQESNVGGFSIASDGGLAGAAFKVTRDSSNYAKLTAIANDSANFPLYNPAASTLSDGLAKLGTEGTLSSVMPMGGLIHLGSVTIEPGTGAGTTEFTISSAGLGNTVTLGYSDLDADGGSDYSAAQSTTFSVAVPEAATLTLLTGPALLLLHRRRRGEST